MVLYTETTQHLYNICIYAQTLGSACTFQHLRHNNKTITKCKHSPAESERHRHRGVCIQWTDLNLAHKLLVR